MVNLIGYFEKELKEYCKNHNYNYDKVKSMPKCGNKDFLVIQRIEKDDRQGLLNDDEPAEILLTLTRKDNGDVIIEESEKVKEKGMIAWY